MGVTVNYGAEELVPIVAYLAGKLTGGDSTSITYEKAEQLMQAVLYCISEWENDREPYDGGGKPAAGNVTARQAYELGYQRVVDKVKRALALYHEILEDFDAYGNRCLQDTIIKDMPEFFRRYDPRFAPHETNLILDYPVHKEIYRYSGVDAVWEYLSGIRQEQIFLGRFDKGYVMETLWSHSPDYMEMIENIADIVRQRLFMQNS